MAGRCASTQRRAATLSVARLVERIAALSPELVNQAIDGLNEIVAV